MPLGFSFTQYGSVLLDSYPRHSVFEWFILPLTVYALQFDGYSRVLEHPALSRKKSPSRSSRAT
jgi:hypothetical protein